MGAHQARAKLPLAVFLSGLQSPCLGSSHRSEICFPVGFRWASAGEAQGTHCPLIPELIPCCGTVLPGRARWFWGSTWSSPFLPGRPGVPTSARQGLRSPGPGPVPPSPKHAGSSLWAFFHHPWGLCLPGSAAWLVEVLPRAEPTFPSWATQ